MGTIAGSASTEIEAPLEAVFAIAADVEGTRRWQPEIKVAECVERDGGNQVLVQMEIDAKVRSLGSKMRFSFEAPERIRWVQEKGDVKALEGSWEFEDLGEGRTQATYRLEVNLGRVLGLAVRGPVVDVLRGRLIDTMPEKLKRFAEESAAV